MRKVKKSKSMKSVIGKFFLINIGIVGITLLSLIALGPILGLIILIDNLFLLPTIISLFLLIFSLTSISIFKLQNNNLIFKFFRQFILSLNITLWFSFIETLLAIKFKNIKLHLLDISEPHFWILLVIIYFISLLTLLFNKK